MKSAQMLPAITFALASLALAAPAGAAGSKTRGTQSQDLRPTGAPAPAPKRSNQYAVSKVLGKKDQKMVDGATACYIDFVYAGEAPQQTVGRTLRQDWCRHDRPRQA